MYGPKENRFPKIAIFSYILYRITFNPHGYADMGNPWVGTHLGDSLSLKAEIIVWGIYGYMCEYINPCAYSCTGMWD